MNTIIINLSYHKNRKYDIIQKLKKTNIINYYFYDAIDGNNLNEYNFKIIPMWFDYFKKRTITIGEIGCALSHYNVWKYIVENKIEKILILEDDVIFYDNFNKMYELVLNIDLSYDIFFLARNPLNKYIELKIGNENIINDYIVEPKTSYNTHSYILTYKGAKKLLNTNYINNILPVDDFLSIMYDKNYPFKQYSIYFDSYNKLKCYALKNDITNQTSQYGSSINNSKLYKKNIKDDVITSNIMVSSTIWTIDLNNKYKSEYENLIKEINIFFDFSDYQNINFLLNHNNDNFCFIEKLIYDNIKFHCNRLNIELDDKYISFWTKKHEYDFDFIHMHIDHCDYESRVHNKEIKRPIFTSILYFDDNNCPTLITDITIDMYNKKDFSNSKQMYFSFPKKLKNIVFEGGKYIHGESYLSDYEKSNRKAIVIAIWNKENKPLYLPYFDKNFYYYHLFFFCERRIDENEYDKFNKDDTLLDIKTRDNIIKLFLTNDDVLNYDFFKRLIINKKKNVLYCLNNLFKNIKDLDTVIIDYSELIIKENFNNMNNFIDIFDINFDNNISLYKELKTIEQEYILDLTNEKKSIVEKYVYDIVLFNLNMINKNIDDFQISFNFINNISSYNLFENNNCLPILSSITFLDDCEKPFLISDININDYKYKFFEKNKSLLFIPNKMTHYIFKGNYYFYNFNNNGFVINIWKKTDKLDFKIYNNKNYLYENDIINYVLKKNIIKPIEIYYNNHILYEHLLYNDDNNIDFINIIEKNKYYIINNSIKNDLVQSNDNINRFSKIQKVKFI